MRSPKRTIAATAGIAAVGLVLAIASIPNSSAAQPELPEAFEPGNCEGENCGECYHVRNSRWPTEYYHVFLEDGCGPFLEGSEAFDLCGYVGSYTCEAESSSHSWCHHGPVLGFCSEHWDCDWPEDGDGNCSVHGG